MLTPENLSRVAYLTQWLASQPHVTGVVSLASPPAAPGGPVINQQQLLAPYTTGAYKQYPALAQFVSSTTIGGMTHISVTRNTKLDSDEGNALNDRLRPD